MINDIGILENKGTVCLDKCHPDNNALFDICLWCPPSMACSIRLSVFPLLQSSYRDRDGAPALVPERCSQQLANVNLPDRLGRVGAPRQQQFSTACE